MTNLEGRVLRRRALREPPPGVRTDLAVLAALAARLRGRAPSYRETHDKGPLLTSREAFPTDPRVVFEELRRASAGGSADYAGISWDRIDADTGVFWPCPDPDGPDTPRLFVDRFATPDGRARFHAVRHRPAAEPVCAEYPLHFTTGRVLAQYQSGVQTRRVAALRRATPGGFVELHPDLADRLGVVDGVEVRVVSRRGELRAPARLSPAIRPDTVFAPFHWPGAARANSVTNDAVDPVSGMPEFKICAVRVERP